MKWNKFRLKTTTEAEDIVSSMLMDLGVQGIEIEDKIPMTQAEKEQMFVDILPETGINDGIAYILSLIHISLIIILTRAGLGLDLSGLKKIGRSAVMMCFVPASL